MNTDIGFSPKSERRKDIIILIVVISVIVTLGIILFSGYIRDHDSIAVLPHANTAELHHERSKVVIVPENTYPDILRMIVCGRQ